VSGGQAASLEFLGGPDHGNVALELAALVLQLGGGLDASASAGDRESLGRDERRESLAEHRVSMVRALDQATRGSAQFFPSAGVPRVPRVLRGGERDASLECDGTSAGSSSTRSGGRASNRGRAAAGLAPWARPNRRSGVPEEEVRRSPAARSRATPEPSTGRRWPGAAAEGAQPLCAWRVSEGRRLAPMPGPERFLSLAGRKSAPGIRALATAPRKTSNGKAARGSGAPRSEATISVEEEILQVLTRAGGVA
jgi:hypothetical protein